jgi:hypothetical protein
MKIKKILQRFKIVKKGFVFFIILFSLIACEQWENLGTGSIVFTLSYVIDDQSLNFNTLIYSNDAGNQYSVSRVKYFVSNIGLGEEDDLTFSTSEVYYVNASEPTTNTILVDSIPVGDYSGFTLNIGLNPTQNQTGYLPNTTENLNMLWPEPMGGGYHFLKFEGHYLDNNSDVSGFAMHLGNNENLVTMHFDHPISIEHSDYHIELEMNLNEWFRNPNLFDLSADGSYIMDDAEAMSLIAENGMDVFSVKSN